jgi:prepilin peptidase CpaA
MVLDSALYNDFIRLMAAVVMILAAVSDASRFRIPNLACLVLLVLFPLYGLTAAQPVDWLGHLEVFAIILGIGYVLYTRKLAGAGDIKFLAVIGLWAGTSYWAPFLVITALSGGVLAFGIGAAAFIKQRNSSKEGRHAWSKTPLPYGVAIALGGLCTLALLSHPELLPRG